MSVSAVSAHPRGVSAACPSLLPVTLDLTAHVGHACRLSLAHWSDGVSWSVETDGSVLEYPAHASPGIPFVLVAHLQEAAGWSAGIPDDIRDALIRHQPLYGEGSFPALWYLSRSIEARQLFSSHPVLFFLVIRQASRDKVDPWEVMTLFTRKRLVLLAYAGFEASPSLLRLMERIDTTRFASNEFVYLSLITQLPGWQRLNHLRSVDGMLLHHVVNDFSLLEARFLTHIDEQWSWTRFKYLYGEIRHMTRGADDAEARVMRCPSMAAIELLHDRLSAELQRRQIEEIPDVAYPPPPLEGSADIVPLTGARELAREGQEMRHCVYSRHDAVMEGRYYVYRVLAPQRATLGVSVAADGQLALDELRLVCNGFPSSVTWTAVEKWLRGRAGSTTDNGSDRR